MVAINKVVVGVIKNPIFWSIVVFAVVLVLVVSGVSGISDSVAEQQKQMLEDAVRRSAVQCYAIEGSYPENVLYLVSNYGLFYDSDNYVVQYRFVGSNLLPDIDVLYIGDEGERVTPEQGGLPILTMN